MGKTTPNRRRKLASAIILGSLALFSLAGPVLVSPLFRHPELGKIIQAWWVGAEYLGEEDVIRQRTAYDCGVVCLQMILKKKGIDSTVEQLRADAGTTAAGTSLLGLRQAIETRGLPASTWRLSLPELRSVPLPAVAFVDGDHFVVVTNISSEDGPVIVLDPARGKLRYSASTFAQRWKGEVLIIGTGNCLLN